MKSDEDARLFTHMQSVLTYQQRLLADRVRNAAFQRALKKHVTEKTSVLDIGTGTGIWAILAAKLGARRVVAIEKEKLLIPVIEKLAKQNRVANKIEIVEGDSREVTLDGRFDLIVSETIGNEAFDEDIVPIMLDARKRFLKRGGTVIPRSVSSVVAPAHFDQLDSKLPAGVNLQYQYLDSLNTDIPRRVNDRSKLRFVAKPRVLTTIDLATLKVAEDIGELRASWVLADASEVNCLVMWAEVSMTSRLRLRTLDSPSWHPIALPIDRMTPGPARIDCQLTTTNKRYYWSLTRRKNGHEETQSHTPVFPYTLLKAHL